MSFDTQERSIQRWLDGELPPAAAAEFAARLEVDAQLQERVRAAEALRQGFAAVRAEAPRAAPTGFTAGVLAAVRRLPDRQLLAQAESAASAVRLCRRVLLAAALLAGLGFAWQVGLFDRGRHDTLQAAPDEVQREMDRLDAAVRAEMGGPRDGR